MAGDPWCEIHGFVRCNCAANRVQSQRFCKQHGWGLCGCWMDFNYNPFPTEPTKPNNIPTLTPSQATTLYQLMAAACVGGYWVPDKEEYDAIKAVLWAISENKEC